MKRFTRRRFTVSTYVRSTWWGLTILALFSGMNAEVISPWIGLGALFLVGWILTPWPERWRFLRPRVIALFLFFFVATLEGVRNFTQNQDVLVMVGDILTGFCPWVLYYRQRGIWYWACFMTTFFIALGSVVAEGGLGTYLLFVFFLGVGAANLNAAHLYQMAGPSQARIQSLTGAYFRQFSGSVLAGFAFGAAIFIFFPRQYTWVTPWGMHSRNRTLGYTNSISLDGSSVNADSSALAFTVESAQPGWFALFSKDLYFRGNTVDHFDGKIWTNKNTERHPYRNDIDLRVSNTNSPQILRMKIYREASSTPNVFYPMVLRFMDLSASRIAGVLYDNNGNLFRARPDAIPYNYEMGVSNPALPAAEGNSLRDMASLAKDGGDGKVPFRPDRRTLSQALEVPESIRKAEYFRAWTKEVGIDPRKETLLHVMTDLKRFFIHHYQPALIHDLNEKNAFEDFLMKTRVGHCEYFATAAALYLRMQGIPSRLVLGYFGGKFNEVSQVFEVRETNAHAWVEAYFPGHGWIAFDPTPPSQPVASLAIVEWATQVYSASAFWFSRYVADYNLRTQLNLMQSMSLHRAGTPIAAPSLKHLWWLLIPGLFTAGVLIQRFRRRQKTLQNELPDYYRKFVSKVSKLGFERGEGESFRAFHLKLEKQGLNPNLVREINSVLELDLYSPWRSQKPFRRKLRASVSRWKTKKAA